MRTQPLILLLLAFSISRAQTPLEQDKSFGNNGSVLLNLYDSIPPTNYLDHQVDKDGNVYILAKRSFSQYYAVDGGSDMILMKLTAKGQLDRNFYQNGIRSVNFYDPRMTYYDYYRMLRISPSDGSVFLFGQMGGENYVTRIRPDGLMDSNFGNKGVKKLAGLANLAIGDVIISADGGFSIFLYAKGGYVPKNPTILYKFDADGDPDLSYGAGGRTSVSFGTIMQIQQYTLLPSGAVLITSTGSSSTDYEPKYSDSLFLIRLTPTGQPDDHFGKAGIVRRKMDLYTVDFVPFDPAYDSKTMILADSSVMFLRLSAGKDVSAIHGAKLEQYKFMPDGRADSSFGTTGSKYESYYGKNLTEFIDTRHSDPFDPSFRVNYIVYNRYNSEKVDTSCYLRLRLTTHGDLDTAYAHFSPIGAVWNAQAMPAFAFAGIWKGGLVGVSPVYGGRSILAARLDSNMAIDAGFGNAGTAVFSDSGSADMLQGLKALPDGRIVGLTFNGQVDESTVSDLGYRSEKVLFRLKAGGGLDSSFGLNGIKRLMFKDDGGHMSPDKSALLVTAAGKILVQPQAIGDSSVGMLQQYTANGTLDVAWGNKGQFFLPAVTANSLTHVERILAQSDGKILILFSAAYIEEYGGKCQLCVLRLNSNGQKDAGFGKNGVANITMADFAPQPMYSALNSGLDMFLLHDGKLLVVTTQEGSAPYFLFKLNKDGSVDKTVGSNGLGAILGEPRDELTPLLAEDDSSRIIFAYQHNFEYPNTNSWLQITRLTKQLDYDYSYNGVGLTSLLGDQSFTMNEILMTGDGRLIFSGVAPSDSVTRYGLAAFKKNGGVDSSFGVDGQMDLTNTVPGNGHMIDPYKYQSSVLLRDHAGQLLTGVTVRQQKLGDVYITKHLLNDTTGKTADAAYGQVNFWTKKLCNDTGPIKVAVNGDTISIISVNTQAPDCGGPGTVGFSLPAGIYNGKAFCNKDTLSFAFSVIADSCVGHQIDLEGDTVISNPPTGVTKPNFHIQPNPVFSTLQIRLDSTDRGTMVIADMSGRQIMAAAFSGNTITLDVKRLPHGMYWVIIKGDSISGTHGFLKL